MHFLLVQDTVARYYYDLYDVDYEGAALIIILTADQPLSILQQLCAF